MKFGITNLSWDKQDDLKVIDFIKKKEVDYIETVYPRINYGYYSTQSIFYGLDLSSFEDLKTFDHLYNIVNNSKKFGIKRIVLGSPSLRKGKKNNLLSVLKKIDILLDDSDLIICLEPNSSYYGGEYYFNIEEIVSDISEFNNIKTMIDTHNLILESLNIFDQYEKYSKFIEHIHISEKDLVEIRDYEFYREYILFLKENNYNKGITYELKKPKNIFSEIEKFINLKYDN
jgi:sugar phosphate isomerase/epimerase